MSRRKKVHSPPSLLTSLLAVLVCLALIFVGVLGQKNLLSQKGEVVGAFASVAPNPYNTLAKELLNREAELNERERHIVERQEKSQQTPTWIVYILGGFGSLLVLNFYLDWRRDRHV